MKLKLSALSLALLPALGMATPDNSINYADDSIIVVYKDGVSKTQKQSARNLVRSKISRLKADERDDRFKNILNGRMTKFSVDGMSVKDALKRLEGHPAIAYAEPNYRLKALGVPDDALFGDLWGMQNTGQSGGTVGADISAVEAWDISTGSADIVVGVIDTGFDYDHVDLAANAWTNPGEIPGNGIDDDGNGYIDDVHGIDTVNGDSDPKDDEGHGTHVSGTIGGTGNNGIGVAGVNHTVSIAGCKFLDSGGSGSTDDAIECIDYMVSLKNAGVNVRVLNNSWGGGGFSQALYDSIQAAEDAEIMFVAAAGNAGSDNDTSPSYPASYDNDGVVAVASVNRFDGDSGYSYGSESVDLAAPGSAIVSTVLNNQYASYSGTSMATPHVAGAAALVWSVNPTLSVTEVKQILMDSGDDNEAMADKTVSGKRLNAHAALIMADPTPRFTFDIVPLSQTVVAGEEAVYTFEVDSISEWEGEVTLSLDDPSGLATLSATTVSAGDTFTLTVATAEDTPWGDYSFTVSGVSGELEDDRTVRLNVLPVGLNDVTYTNTTPVEIPDANIEGIESVISVPDPLTVFGTSVSVDITHTWRGDLTVYLTSPSGTQFMIANREGGSEDDIVGEFATDVFNGEVATGDWTLFVSDGANADLGTLNSWGVTFSALGEVQPLPPQAGFSYEAQQLTVSFTDTSSDANGDIVSWEWSFGDLEGGTSSEQNPVYTYAMDGAYDVSLTVTDAEGQSDTFYSVVEVSAVDVVIEASVRRAMLSRLGNLRVDLEWSGASTDMVEIYRNGTLIATTDNSGMFRDTERRVSGTEFVYQICDTEGNCSEELTVSF